MDGIINIKKEKGFTSHDVVAIVRKTLNTRKVGHTGTLDPEAEGVLPICVGKGTKLSDYIMAAEKEYLAEITFGVTTTTQDYTGEVIETKEVNFNEEEIKNSIFSFIGDIEQIPPMFSAIKINGKKLYDLARQGEEVERAPRKITIHNIEILSITPPNKCEILVKCSKGTYIRTLCYDIGEKLGYGAHMSSLIRTKSGSFKIEEAITLNELKEFVANEETHKIMMPLAKALENYKVIKVSKKADRLIHNGCKIYEEYFEKVSAEYFIDEKIIAYDSENNLVGIFSVKEEEEKIFIKPNKILL